MFVSLVCVYNDHFVVSELLLTSTILESSLIRFMLAQCCE